MGSRDMDERRIDGLMGRDEAVQELRVAIDRGLDWREALWNCVRSYQNEKFTTFGRGANHARAIEFTYSIKISSRSGEETGELIFSNRRSLKTVTRKTAEQALRNALEEQNEFGFVSGPKKLKVWGHSNLYAMFVRWGVILQKPCQE